MAARPAGWRCVLVPRRRNPWSGCAPTLTPSLPSVPGRTSSPLISRLVCWTGDRPVGRECDRLARRRLPGRSSSVFSPPVRSLLGATRYGQVRGHGLSIQAFGILAKIREVDRLMTPELQGRVYEAHPELAFRSLAGAPMRHSKKTPAGREERLRALERLASFRAVRALLDTVATRYRRSQVGLDDCLDACVLAWLAGRIGVGTAQWLPAQPPLDARGLRMEIWY